MNDGCSGGVTITAGDSAISGWTAAVTLTAPQKVTAVWNAAAAWDGSGNAMTVEPSWNGSLAAGASTSFGLTVAKNGSGAVPAVGTCAAAWDPGGRNPRGAPSGAPRGNGSAERVQRQQRLGRAAVVHE